eukprot:6088695-Pyramimonas_sp.AAC.1
MELFEKEHELERLKERAGGLPAWRRWMLRAMDPNRVVNVQRAAYVLIFAHMAYRIYRMMAFSPVRS